MLFVLIATIIEKENVYKLNLVKQI